MNPTATHSLSIATEVQACNFQKLNTISEFTEKGWFDAPLPQLRQKIVDQKLAGQELDMVENGYFHDFVASLRTTYDGFKTGSNQK